MPRAVRCTKSGGLFDFMIRELIGYAGLLMVVWGVRIVSVPAALVLGGCAVVRGCDLWIAGTKKAKG